jgi:hypothetical protein
VALRKEEFICNLWWLPALNLVYLIDLLPERILKSPQPYGSVELEETESITLYIQELTKCGYSGIQHVRGERPELPGTCISEAAKERELE